MDAVTSERSTDGSPGRSAADVAGRSRPPRARSAGPDDGLADLGQPGCDRGADAPGPLAGAARPAQQQRLARGGVFSSRFPGQAKASISGRLRWLRIVAAVALAAAAAASTCRASPVAVPCRPARGEGAAHAVVDVDDDRSSGALAQRDRWRLTIERLCVPHDQHEAVRELDTPSGQRARACALASSLAATAAAAAPPLVGVAVRKPQCRAGFSAAAGSGSSAPQARPSSSHSSSGPAAARPSS